MEPTTQANAEVVTANDPPAGGGAGTANTLENLAVNIANQLNSLSDESTGATTPPAATDAPGEPPAAPDTKVDETKHAEVVDEATMHRISQDNANLRTTLIKLGVDPDSDTAEQLRSGLITVDDLIRARTPAVPATTQTPEPTTPQIPLDQKIINFRNRLNREGAVTDALYKEDMSAALDVIMDVVQANQNINQTMENNELNNLLTATMNVTKETFRSDVKSVIPEDVREIAEGLYIGGTEIAAGHLARRIGREKAFTKDGYRYAAQQVAPKFDQFVQSIFKAGGDATLKAIKKANPTIKTAVVNPIAPGVGSLTPPPPVDKGKFSMQNLDANVKEFLAGTQRQV